MEVFDRLESRDVYLSNSKLIVVLHFWALDAQLSCLRPKADFHSQQSKYTAFVTE